MRLQTLLLLLSAIFFSVNSRAQKIVYSEPDRGDTRRMDFEVIGKIAGNFLVYKEISNKTYITAYDNDMKVVNKEEHEYVPDERMINVDFFPYLDFAYMVYQYQKRNVVYCNAVKVDGQGKKNVRSCYTGYLSYRICR